MQHRDLVVAHLRLALAMARSHADVAHVRQRVDDWLDHMRVSLDPLRDWAATCEPFVQASVQALAMRLRECRDHDGTTVEEVSGAVDHVVRRSGCPGLQILDQLRSDRHELVNRAQALRAEHMLRRSLRLALVEAARHCPDLRPMLEAELENRSGRHLPSLAEVEGWWQNLAQRSPTPREQNVWRCKVDSVVLVDDDPYHLALMRWAADVAMAGRVPLQVHTFTCVEGVDTFLRTRESRHHVLLVTDLGLPERGDGTGAAREDHGRRLVSEWAMVHPTIVVTAHGRLYDEFEAMPGWRGRTGPDGFVPKLRGWEVELAEVLQRALNPTPLANATLDVLTFTGRSILVDGIEVDLGPTSFWLLDTLARPEQQTSGLERFKRSNPRGGPPMVKTAENLGTSLIMSGVLPLPDNTAAFWHTFHHSHPKQIRDLNHAVYTALTQAGACYEGKLVTPMEAGRERERLHWRARRYSVTCRHVRRWTTLVDYLAHAKVDEPLRVLMVESEHEWRAQLRAAINDLLEVELEEAADAEEALRLARDNPPHAIVLDLQLAGDRETGRLSGVELRERLHREVGPVPVICLSEYVDSSVKRSLLRATQAEGGGGSDVSARLVPVVRKRGRMEEECDDVVRFLLECRNARRRNRHVVRGELGPRHRVVVDRDRPHVIEVDGQEVSFARPISRSGPAADLAQAVLVVLAEADHVWHDRRALLGRLVARGALDTAGKDFPQHITRAIMALRKALTQCVGKEEAWRLLDGKSPYRLRGQVELRGGPAR